MESSDHFRLKWDNFQKSMFAALENLHLSEEFVDVTLYCDGISIKAHKVILSACSPYFRTVFKDNPCKHPVVIIKGVSSDDIAALLSFMYQGEVCVPHERLAGLLHAAELLKVRGLTAAFGCDGSVKTTFSTYFDTTQNDVDEDAASQKEIVDRAEHASKKHALSEDSNSSDSSVVKTKKKKVLADNQSDENENCETAENSDERLKQTVPEELNDGSAEKFQNSNNAFVVRDSDENRNNSEQHWLDDDENAVVIKKEIIETNNEEEIGIEQLPSILQRSLIGDHTVKPAESLIITPDLPLETSTVVKCESGDPLCHSEPPPLVPIRFYNKNDSKYHAQNTLSQQEVKTLEILKNNPNISVSAEKISDESPTSYSKSSSKQKTRCVKQIEPEISIKPVKQFRTVVVPAARLQKPGANHKNDGTAERTSAYGVSESGVNIKQSILAQNLIQGCQIQKQQQGPATHNKQSGSPATQQNLPQLLYQSTSTGVPSNQGQIWNCPHCTQVYNNQSALKYHVRLVHSDFTNRLCCFLCPTSFTMRESYKIHMFETHGIRN